MAFKNPVTAIIERLKAKAKQPSKAGHDWISFAKGVVEVSSALGLSSEVAQMTLFGLIATGEIPASDKKDLIDIDRCTIAELSKLAFVSAGELRNWLREQSTSPLSNRDAVIAEKLRAGDVPGRNIPWKQFCDDVRNQCNARRSKGRPVFGFEDKQIQRAVKALKQR
jgi:hypothetical protein